MEGVSLDLQVEILAKLFMKPLDFGDIARKANEPLSVRCQHLFIDPRLVIKPLQESDRGQFAQVPVALNIFGEQNDGQTVGRAGNSLFLQPRTWRHPNFAAQNRLYASGLTSLVELDGAI